MTPKEHKEIAKYRKNGFYIFDIISSVLMTERLHFHALEEEMATYSSVLAWRIPGTGEPGGLPSMGLQSRTRLKRLSSSSSSFYLFIDFWKIFCRISVKLFLNIGRIL